METGSDACPVAFHQSAQDLSPNRNIWFIPQAEYMAKKANIACHAALDRKFQIFEVNRWFIMPHIQMDICPPSPSAHLD